MRHGIIFAALFALFLSGTSAFPAQQQKKPKSPLTSAIDSTAGGFMGSAKASPVAEDGEFLRRVMLDLVGYPPSLEEVKAFMADTNVDKRSEMIDKLIASEDWADRTARLFCEGWFGNYHEVPIMITPMLDSGAKSRVMNDFVSWMKLKLNKDAPYNKEIVDAIIKARGTGTGDPAMLWKLACFSGGDDGPAIEFANRISRHFLGIRLRCAQCHDHPFDVWNQGHFYKMAAFFGRTRASGGTDVELKEVDDVESLKYSGGNYQPQFIMGQKPGKGDPWMDSLALYVTMDSPQLATATANRVWSWLFGRGLVHPVDDFNRAQTPFAGGMIGVLAKELKGSKYSIKALYRGICNSDTYQRASGNEAKMTKPSFAASWIKHLDAEQLLNSITVATGGKPTRDVNQAIGLVSPLFPADVVWCEVTPLPGNMRQALFVRNNNMIQGQISSGLGKIQGATLADKVTEMFLAVVSRKPTAAETERFVKYINGHQGAGMEDAYWTLMNTTEFLSRH
ncbi:MAG TPA: DUF1549 domain-containing protein [Planctomycetota bacterium]|nr:DUF1549 domain-containing protein [Planctomycetota bacterium]